MTLDQLRIFVAVAEREHMTRAAEVLHLTQPAVSAAVAALEARHGVRLFHRVGRAIQLTGAGRALLVEARAVLDRVSRADLMLAEFGGLARGTLRLAASQTVGGYWLPRRLDAFARRYPGIELALEIGNTGSVAEAVRQGQADLGFVEGAVEDPVLTRWTLDEDRLALVQSEPGPARTDADWLRGRRWVLRESGSGTRSSFEAVIGNLGISTGKLDVALVLPSNEAVRGAAEAGAGAAVLSSLVVAASIAAGTLHALPLAMPPRCFYGLRHRERYPGKAGEALVGMLGAAG